MTEEGITVAEVELVLQRALQRDLKLLDFKLNTFSDKVGFMGDHNMLTVHYCDANGPGEFSFFLKLLPKGKYSRNIALKYGLFTKEKEMYEKLLPLMAKALGRRMPAADCYLIRDDGCMVLEDLSRMGYKLWDKYAFLGRRQAEAALKAVAALHAGSLAVEVGTDALMPRHADHCYEALIADSSSDNIVVRQWHFSSLKTCCSLLQKMQCYKSRVAGATDWDSVFEKLHRAWDCSALVTQGFSAKYRNVLSHGDLWVNNMLFKDELDHVEAVLVDFQTYRYAPPILDLLMLLHCATSREFRAQHQKELIELYFRELENLL
ncbi:Hypothetical predicted protein [Cloeon dipterum]|uniref:CHK kinase-like domain-containing protein n=1 Tax=Cloeon dipterum TaxID=197152 RepID=A0A8S1CSN8_9INSE|nr:Hypothetical predicted protein [Cloeon dipterum]